MAAVSTQQPGMPVIGYLSVAAEGTDRHLLAGFRKGLGEQGYVEGRSRFCTAGLTSATNA